MKGIAGVLLSLPVLFAVQVAASPPTNSPSARVLFIDRALIRTSGAKATLTVSPLQRTADIYAGDYQVKVWPYSFKSEKGKLAIVVPGESLEKVSKGIQAEISGTAVTDGEKGRQRPVHATATPLGPDHGTLKIWFLSGKRKLTFNTSYSFRAQ